MVRTQLLFSSNASNCCTPLNPTDNYGLILYYQKKTIGRVIKRFDEVYKTIWRWHFYAGIFCAPILIVIAITGAIYLFQSELDQVMYNDLITVSQEERYLAPDVQKNIINKQYPGKSILLFIPPKNVTSSSEFVITTDSKEKLSIFLNPYSGYILGQRLETDYFQYIVKKIHGTLLIGDIGDWLIELVVSWGLVLVLTGLYLSFPRTIRVSLNSLIPRLDLRGRKLWKNLHIVGGNYASLLIIFFILSGLPWTGFWGAKFIGVWDRFPVGMFSGYPTSGSTSSTLNHDNHEIIPWAQEEILLPQSENTKTNITLNEIYAFALESKIIPGYKISLPQDHQGVYTISSIPSKANDEVTYHIDQHSGKVLMKVGFDDYSNFAKIVELGVSIHKGHYFGILNRVLALITCILLILLSVTGLYMWWKRRPVGEFGVPKSGENILKYKKVIFILLVLSFLLPMIGISLIIVLLSEYAIKKITQK